MPSPLPHILLVLSLLLWAPAARAALDVDCTPIAETGYDAGTPFPLTVITINGKKVEQNLARAWYQMYLAAQADGVTLTLVSGFRTMAQQQYLWDCYKGKSGGSCPAGCSSCNIAATPGYSKHQKGDAVDVSTNGGTNTAYKWLKGTGGYSPHGQSFGFLDTFNPPEPWHWVYVNPGPWVGPCDDGGPVESPTACTPAAVSGAEGEIFKDMPPGAFGKAEAEALLAAGITNGCAPDLYCPTCIATRAQAVTLLLRAADIDVGGPPATTSFDDVAPTAYYAAYVEKALELGITSGCSPTQFCPDEPTTRKQFAKFLIETLDVPTVSPATATFSDVPKGDWGYPYVETLKALCITTGCSPTTFCPGEHVTRAMAAVFIARAFDLQDSNDCIQYCDAATCAGASFCENWDTCAFADQCVETGSQSRTCHDFGCSGPVTDAECLDSTSAQTQSCSRDTDGDVVAGWSAWSACAANEPCGETGTQSRSRTVCSGGVAVEETGSQGCTPPEDPACHQPDPDPEPQAEAVKDTAVVDTAVVDPAIVDTAVPVEAPEVGPEDDTAPLPDVAPGPDADEGGGTDATRDADPPQRADAARPVASDVGGIADATRGTGGRQADTPGSDSQGSSSTGFPSSGGGDVSTLDQPATAGGCGAAGGDAGWPLGPLALLLLLLSLVRAPRAPSEHA